ncbi:Acyltransferase LovD [Cyphellophora attinorum]|uniref:Acyltransferase LovD n=1 Tax=Cyphellophora attinorum TaxID=1664694 RepID=A0A0N0NPD1_9EURO|nr:Acyltransferase LovD [Phialophora attinorum]KPI42611.1 Acyltransferase LovD [Phialophora attinorum]
MSGVRRFLSVRDKSPRPKDGKHGHHVLHKSIGHDSLSTEAQGTGEPKLEPLDPESVADFYVRTSAAAVFPSGLFNSKATAEGRPEEQKIKAIRLRLSEKKGIQIRDSTILWALHSPVSENDDDRAYDFLLALSDASESMVSPYRSGTHMRGAVNRQAVTCFLDSTLFAIFSHLDSFEPMLYNPFPDLPRQKLSFLLRLWVNMLRTGQLITTDITARIQGAIADCGWADAAELQQQDASEAFTFITDKLDLPLLTLKMDIFHAGKEDETDDHKFINERLLEVAIPEDPTGQRKEIRLEDCLEEYFNNKIEVRRYLERRATMNSVKSPVEPSIKAAAIHVETIEIDPESSSPATPISSGPPMPSRPRMPARPRQQSIIQDRFTPSQSASGQDTLTEVPTEASNRSRAGSVRKTVMMPGWQFFSLIPWYTDNTPTNDAQIAAHFSDRRPVLGLCLKRYTFKNGQPARLGTYIDIPIEIGLPHFIQDDAVTDNGAIFGNFKLSLQSVVCHRGNSVDSGHYVALVRSPLNEGATSSGVSNQWFTIRLKAGVTLNHLQQLLSSLHRQHRRIQFRGSLRTFDKNPSIVQTRPTNTFLLPTSRMAKIQEAAIPNLRAQIDELTASAEDGAAGIVFSAINKKGETIFEHASGTLGVGKPEPMTLDSIFWIASCTKMITGVACMQLVEQGKITLDSVEEVEKICPELKAVKVLQDDGKLVEKERGITLRMLLSHTAGFGYSFFNSKLLNHYGASGLDEFTGSYSQFLTQPLVNQPGSRWEYGINIDWAGLIVSRITGKSLNDYFHDHIFKPLEIKNISMFPTPEMASRLAWMNFRDNSTGKLGLNLGGHIVREQLMAAGDKSEEGRVFNAGGHGCFARPTEYTRIIAMLLNDGKSPYSGEQILKKETVDEMFTNQIPDMPDFGRQPISPPRPDFSNALPALYPEEGNPAQGWGLTFFLHLQDSAVHSKGTGWWAGLANLFWWCDRTRGVGGMIASQILPFGDLKVMGLWGQLEGGINAALEG